jgi:hypothetical protein
MFTLYGSMELAGAGTMLISTAFVILTLCKTAADELELDATDFPCFDNHPNPLPHENHPTRVFVVIHKVKQDNELNKNIRNNLFS